MSDEEVRHELMKGGLCMSLYLACPSFCRQGQRDMIRSEIENGHFGDRVGVGLGWRSV